jgi:N6-L-threonylcarbamoyladenine synthase
VTQAGASSPSSTAREARDPGRSPEHSAPRLALGIETSCDETAAAVVAEDGAIRSSVVRSQVDLHAAFGGVVPEIASRAHLELVVPAVDQALRRAGLDGLPGCARAIGEDRAHVPAAAGPDLVAATVGPGLVGALLVGASSGKALALVLGVPFVGVNHLEGHLFAALLDHHDLRWPVVVLLVSGGHSLLAEMYGPGRYRLLGQTLDDAAGEAFDKVARFLGLGYPGGPAIEQAAMRGDPDAVPLPRVMDDEGLDLSFSGLKTAVVRFVEANPDVSSDDAAAAFQRRAIEQLVRKAVLAARRIRAQGLCLAGGVAANGALRSAMADAAEDLGLPLYVPSRAMCTDNAAMIAAAGLWQLEHFGPTPLDAPVDAELSLLSSPWIR